MSEDGRTYTYTLRDGVTRQDGEEVTSRDIEYGIERLRAQDTLPGLPSISSRSSIPGGHRGPYEDKLGLSAIRTPDARTIVCKRPKPKGTSNTCRRWPPLLR
ncbi:ABC transporter substrate-binding protein [Streptomyces sp. NPDC006368]|uniref:ABC transporter substrate-binding protein n=1 Tax=Streptomyces sp. NPDC006368 TaxID=3156760 RepID=UPI0033A6F3ED